MNPCARLGLSSCWPQVSVGWDWFLPTGLASLLTSILASISPNLGMLSQRPHCREFGLLLGPIHMLLLAVGLGIVLRLYKRLGILAALKSVDYFLLALVLAFTLRQGNQIYHLACSAERIR